MASILPPPCFFLLLISPVFTKTEFPVLSVEVFTSLSPSSYPTNMYLAEKYLEGEKMIIEPNPQMRHPTRANEYRHFSFGWKVPMEYPTTCPRGEVTLITVIIRVLRDLIPN